MALASIQLANDEAYVFAAGGSGPVGDNASFTAFTQYSVARNEWSVFPSLPNGRINAAAAAVSIDDDFYVFVIGGADPFAEGCPAVPTLR